MLREVGWLELGVLVSTVLVACGGGAKADRDDGGLTEAVGSTSGPNGGGGGNAAQSSGAGTGGAGAGGPGSGGAGGSIPLAPGPIAIDLEGSLQNPCFSPNGTSIALTRFRDGYNEGASVVAVVGALGGTPLVLTEDSPRPAARGAQAVNLPGSCWNAALDRIAYSSDVGVHDEIYLVPPGGGAAVQVTDRPGDVAWEPSLSPDAQWVVFESHPATDSETPGTIWKIRVDGSALTQLTFGEGDDRQPNWSPAGDRILFQRTGSDGDIDIWTMATDGTDLVDVTDSPAQDTDASWSPDGAKIVYSSDEGSLDLAAVFVIGKAGGQPVRVTTSDAYCGAPAWSPDGAWIAFETTPGDPDGSAGATLAVVQAP